MFKRNRSQQPVITLMKRRTPTRQLDRDQLTRDDETVALLSALRAALPAKRCCSVGIISTLHGEGVSTLAQSLASVAARNPRMKVLLCKVSNHREPGEAAAPFIFIETITTRDREGTSANHIGGFPLAHAAQNAAGTDASMGAMGSPSDDLQSIVASVGGSFDLVIVELPPVHDSSLGASLARGLDGVLMVVEAERTRTHAMRAAKQSIEACGGTILGVVLNKRRFHIPQFIYRHL